MKRRQVESDPDPRVRQRPMEGGDRDERGYVDPLARREGDPRKVGRDRRPGGSGRRDEVVGHAGAGASAPAVRARDRARRDVETERQIERGPAHVPLLPRGARASGRAPASHVRLGGVARHAAHVRQHRDPGQELREEDIGRGDVRDPHAERERSAAGRIEKRRRTQLRERAASQRCLGNGLRDHRLPGQELEPVDEGKREDGAARRRGGHDCGDGQRSRETDGLGHDAHLRSVKDLAGDGGSHRERRAESCGA